MRFLWAVSTAATLFVATEAVEQPGKCSDSLEAASALLRSLFPPSPADSQRRLQVDDYLANSRAREPPKQSSGSSSWFAQSDSRSPAPRLVLDQAVESASGTFQVYQSDSRLVKRNKALSSIALLTRSADSASCSINASISLADALLLGNYNLVRNTTAALAYYSSAASIAASYTSTQVSKVDSDIAYIYRMLGLLHAIGIGTEQDYAKAMVYLSFASLRGDLVASQTLGYYHLSGIATVKSCSDAQLYYRRVADHILSLYQSGPPGGRHLPYPGKSRIPDDNGGIYGHGASGAGNPMLFNQNVHQAAISAEDVIVHYEFLANKGDVTAQQLFGQLLYQGSPELPQNYPRAFFYFYKAAQQYPKGAHAVALKAGPSSDAYKSLPKPVISHAKAAADSAAMVGRMYWRGEGLPAADPGLARQWFERAERWGSALAMTSLGEMMQRSEAGFEAFTLATRIKELYTAAAAKNDPDGQALLGELLYNSQDYPLAFKYFTYASRQGNMLAIYRMGMMYIDGQGTQESCTLGVGFLKNFIEKGDWQVSYHRQGKSLYQQGDVEGAFITFALSAEIGIEESQVNTAWIVDQGDYQSLAGRSTHSWPVLGAGVDEFRVALTFWNRAANQGNVDARVKMGDYHFYGLGMPNKTDGSLGVGSTSDPGNDAQEKRESLEEDSVPLDVFGVLLHLVFPYKRGSAISSRPDYKKAATYYQVAAESEQSAVAMFDLAYMYEHGFGIPRDLHLAKRYYDSALTTNPEAYLPVNLSLLKLYVKMLFYRSPTASSSTASDRGTSSIGGGEGGGITTDDSHLDLPPAPHMEQDEDYHVDGEYGDAENGTFGNILLACILVYMAWRYGNDWINRIQGDRRQPVRPPQRGQNVRETPSANVQQSTSSSSSSTAVGTVPASETTSPMASSTPRPGPVSGGSASPKGEGEAKKAD